MSKKKLAPWAITITLSWLTISGFLTWRSLGEFKLARPVTIESVLAFPDGGTLQIHIFDGQNNRVTLIRVGDLNIQSQAQKLQVQKTMMGWIPVFRTIEIGSSSESEIRDGLNLYIAERKIENNISRPSSIDTQSIPEDDWRLIAVGDLLEWIKNRK